MRLFYYLLLLIFIWSCESKTTELVWNRSFYLIGTQSSPRATDLNGDGVLDIVLGAGKAELDSTSQGIIALDGKSGEPIWEKKTSAAMVGSANFLDLTKDGVNDVIIGGRNHILKAINGSSGDLIWEYNYKYASDPILKYAKYNFYNGQLIDDVNGNGYKELLTVNGGNWEAKPNENTDRFPAVLMLIDTKAGDVIVADTMPDGKESYMSPVCFKQKNSDQLNIVFGTGGETTGGNVYMTSLKQLMNRNLSSAKVLVSEVNHGYIAPAAIADLNSDSVLDILTVSHASKISAIDGSSFNTIWEHKFAGKEVSSSFTIGQFTGDKSPDVFTIMSKGIWPDYSSGTHIMMEGTTGEIMYRDSSACYSLTTPVAIDLTSDGIDEIILSANNYDCNIDFFEDVKGTENMVNQLIALNFKSGSKQEIDTSPNFRNIYSSPWVGDIDNDDFVDIVYTQNFDPADLFRFRGMRVKRISTNIKMPNKKVLWGEYMGRAGKSVYKESDNQ